MLSGSSYSSEQSSHRASHTSSSTTTVSTSIPSTSSEQAQTSRPSLLGPFKSDQPIPKMKLASYKPSQECARVSRNCTDSHNPWPILSMHFGRSRKTSLGAEWELVNTPSVPSDLIAPATTAPQNAMSKSRRFIKGLSLGSSTGLAPPPGRPSLEKSELTWPVELGNGRGNRMSVALPLDKQVDKSRVSTTLIRSADLQYPHATSSPTHSHDVRDLTREPLLLSSLGVPLDQPYRCFKASDPASNRGSRQVATNRDQGGQNIYTDEPAYRNVNSTLSSRHDWSFPHSPLSSDEISSTSLTLPRTPTSIIYSPPARRVYNLPGRFTSSTENVSPRPSGHVPPSPSYPEFQVGNSSLQASNVLDRRSGPSLTNTLSRPNMKTPPRKALATNASQFLTPSPLQVSNQRTRRSSLTDPSSWRWLQSTKPQPILDPSERLSKSDLIYQLNPSDDLISSPKPAAPHSHLPPTPFVNLSHLYQLNPPPHEFSTSTFPLQHRPRPSGLNQCPPTHSAPRPDSLGFAASKSHTTSFDLLPDRPIYRKLDLPSASTSRRPSSIPARPDRSKGGYVKSFGFPNTCSIRIWSHNIFASQELSLSQYFTIRQSLYF